MQAVRITAVLALLFAAVAAAQGGGAVPSRMQVAHDEGEVCIGETSSEQVCLARMADGSLSINTATDDAKVTLNGRDVLSELEQVTSIATQLSARIAALEGAGPTTCRPHSDADGNPATSCYRIMETGASTSGVYCIQTAGGPRMLYCDMQGGWTLVGQVSHLHDSYDYWLRADKSIINLRTPAIEPDEVACIDAVDMAVNHATEIRFSDADQSHWVSWRMDADRNASIYWHHEAGPAAVMDAAEEQHTTAVSTWAGFAGICYTNAYGIMATAGHGGSYPGTFYNYQGNTIPNDYCMSVGVMVAGSQHVDGWSTNGNGQDTPSSSDPDTWPNTGYNNGQPAVSVWLRPDCTPTLVNDAPVYSCKELYSAGVTTDGAYCISTTSGPRRLYCDMSSGGWTLVGKVEHDKDIEMYRYWLTAAVNVDLLTHSTIEDEKLSCIDARDMAVNHATRLRLSNSDISKWAHWPLHEDRTMETWWNHAAGPDVITAAATADPSTIAVTTSWGDSGTCYHNKYGIMPTQGHGGSYPGVFYNAQGNTVGGDVCFSVGVMGVHDADNKAMPGGWQNNLNGHDVAHDESEWPNTAINNNGAHVAVWLK